MKYPKLPEVLDRRKVLTSDNIKEMKKLRKLGMSGKEIGIKFDVSKTIVYYHTNPKEYRDAVNKKRYQDLKQKCKADPAFAKAHQEAKTKSYVEGYQKYPERAKYKGKETAKWKKKKYHTDPIYRNKIKKEALETYYRNNFKGIELNGTRYTEGNKCIACSSEVDKRGRFELKKRTRYYLKCDNCAYTILSKATRQKKERYEAKRDGLTY